MVMAALNSRETGQFALAPAARDWNCSSPMPGTQDSFSRWTAVMVHFPSTCSSDTLACVAMRVGVKPARVSSAVSAMVKQPACAAASNSSGLVPGSFSKRVTNE